MNLINIKKISSNYFLFYILRKDSKVQELDVSNW